MNPLNGMMHQIRVLLDSGANLSLINNDVARKIGLPGDTVNVLPEEGLSLDMLKRSHFSWSA